MKMLRNGAIALACVGLAWLTLWMLAERQRPTGTDEQQILAVLAEGAAAAQRRETRGVTQFISNDYRDDLIANATQARVQIGRVLRENPSIQVMIPEQSVTISLAPDRESAEVSFELTLYLGDAGQRLSQVTLEMVKEPVRYLLFFSGAEWRVKGADGYATDL